MFLLMSYKEDDYGVYHEPMGLFKTIPELKAHIGNYLYEIYDIDGTSIKLIKESDDFDEEGFALCRMDEDKDWFDEDGYKVIKKFPNLKREDITKKTLKEYFPTKLIDSNDNITDVVAELHSCGAYVGQDGYCLTEYSDHKCYCPY